jgi:two-component system, cell cycle sensor histidine kinase and response regulator CckA
VEASPSKSTGLPESRPAEAADVRPPTHVLAWMVVAVLGSGLIVWLLAFTPLPLRPGEYLAIHSAMAAALVAGIAYFYCFKPFFLRVHELQSRSEQIDRIRQDIQNRLTERDAELTATRAKLEGESSLRQKAEAEGRRLLEEMERRVTERTALLDEAVRELKGELTERRRALDALRESEKRYRHLIEIADEGIWTINAQGKTNFINPRGAQLLGYTVPETLGRVPEDLVVIGDLPAELRSFDLQKMGCAPALEFRTQRQKGRETWMRASVTAITGEMGEYLGALILFSDVTRRRQEEQRLQLQVALLNTAQDAVIVCNAGLHVLSWNPGASRLYGWTAEEVLGRDFFDLVGAPETVAVKQAMLQGLQQKKEWRGELAQVAKDGHELTVDARLTLSNSGDGRTESVLLLATDITQAKRDHARQLRDQRRESAATLAHGLAHDLNNLLSPIVLSAQLLRTKRLDQEDQSLLTAIELGAERTAELVQQSLAFARGVEGDRVRVEPTRLIREILDIAHETFPRNVQVICDVPADTWGVQGDPGQLHQVILRLCVHARDAMSASGGGVLSLKTRNLQADDPLVHHSDHLKPGPHVLVEIHDTGPTLGPGMEERIFEPFFSAKERRQSASLAMSLVMGMVRSHGGTIEVRSRAGSGTRFLVLLPALPELPASAAKPAPSDLPDGRGELILMVEDEAGVRDVTCKTLNHHGYEVIAARDGLEALGMLAENQGRVKLVFTSISMPSMDGPSLARAARQIDPRVPIIASTTQGRSPGQGDKLAALQSVGIRRLLAKPYSTSDLLNAIRDELGGNGLS